MKILTMKQGKAQTALISSTGKKLDAAIHLVGVSGIAHCLAHSDTTLISELCRAMPKSSRGNALKFWFTKHLSIEWKAKAHGGAGGFVVKKDHGMKDMHWAEKAAIVIAANAKPFYEKEDKEASVYNPNATLLSMVKRVSKDHVAFDEASVTALEQLLAQARQEAVA